MGVGDELAASIEWVGFFFRKKFGDCESCRSRRNLMNKWGPEGCEINRVTILLWLEEAAHQNKIPFNKKVANLMITNAIKKANKKTPSPVSQ